MPMNSNDPDGGCRLLVLCRCILYAVHKLVKSKCIIAQQWRVVLKNTYYKPALISHI